MRAWGGTALYDVVLNGLNLLGRYPGRRAMLLFSDGDDQSSHASLEAAVARAEASDATMYVIGQGRAIRAPELQTILRRFATISGGQHFFTEDVTKLDRFFEEILQDLSNQYSFGTRFPTPIAMAACTRYASRSGTASITSAPARDTGCQRTEHAAPKAT